MRREGRGCNAGSIEVAQNYSCSELHAYFAHILVSLIPCRSYRSIRTGRVAYCDQLSP